MYYVCIMKLKQCSHIGTSYMKAVRPEEWTKNDHVEGRKSVEQSLSSNGATMVHQNYSSIASTHTMMFWDEDPMVFWGKIAQYTVCRSYFTEIRGVGHPHCCFFHYSTERRRVGTFPGFVLCSRDCTEYTGKKTRKEISIAIITGPWKNTFFWDSPIFKDIRFDMETK